MLGGNQTEATKPCENWLLRAASVRCEATTHLIFQMFNGQVSTLSGNSLRIFEAEFFLVPSQMPVLPDW